MSSTSKKEGLSKRRSEMAIARAYIRKKIDFKIIFQTILENSYMNLFYDWIKQFLPKGSYFCSVILLPLLQVNQAVFVSLSF